MKQSHPERRMNLSHQFISCTQRAPPPTLSGDPNVTCAKSVASKRGKMKAGRPRLSANTLRHKGLVAFRFRLGDTNPVRAASQGTVIRNDLLRAYLGRRYIVPETRAYPNN